MALLRRSMPHLDFHNIDFETDDLEEPLALEHFLAVFVILIIGLFAAFLVLLHELKFKNKITGHYRLSGQRNRTIKPGRNLDRSNRLVAFT